MPGVYDDQQQTTDDLNDITGIDPAQEAEMERTAHSGAADDIAEREGLFNPSDSPEDDKKKSSASELQDAESTKKPSADSLFRGEDGKAGGFAGQ